jgi:hypothetical protein
MAYESAGNNVSNVGAGAGAAAGLGGVFAGAGRFCWACAGAASVISDTKMAAACREIRFMGCTFLSATIFVQLLFFL